MAKRALLFSALSLIGLAAAARLLLFDAEVPEVRSKREALQTNQSSANTRVTREPLAHSLGNQSHQEEPSQNRLDIGPILGSYEGRATAGMRIQKLTQAERATIEDLLTQLEQATEPEEKVDALSELRQFSLTPAMLSTLIHILSDPDAGVRKKEIGPGLLQKMLNDLGLRRSDIEE